MNIYILLTTVMLMPTAPTPKDHSTARVVVVILVMGLSDTMQRDKKQNYLTKNNNNLYSHYSGTKQS